MMILAHRGLWQDPTDGNSLSALTKALEAGFGLETDVRDCDGELVVSHDPAKRGAVPLTALFGVYSALQNGAILALNIKADGLQAPLAQALQRYGIGPDRYFVFDMAVADALGYLRRQMPCFTRQSEIEPVPAFVDRAAGVWLDCFERDWITEADVMAHCLAGRRVALVSPELHGRAFEPVWREWRKAYHSLCRHGHGDRMMLCTDHAYEARAYFDAAD